jgi:hypothetical protein
VALGSPKNVSERWTVVYQGVAKACRTTEVAREVEMKDNVSGNAQDTQED